MGDICIDDFNDPQYNVGHPLWSRFLRWCTIRPKQNERPRQSSLVSVGQERIVRLESLNEYKYTPLPDPQSFIRLVTLLPGEFDDDVRVTIHHDALRPPSAGRKTRKMALAEIRRDLPEGWEAFQTVSEGRQRLPPPLFVGAAVN
jgi:hypothetical protein